MIVVDHEDRENRRREEPAVNGSANASGLSGISEKIGGVRPFLYTRRRGRRHRPISARNDACGSFCGEVPCTRAMTAEEIAGEYERETGRLIVETLTGRDVMAVPAVLRSPHIAFVWETTALGGAVRRAAILERSRPHGVPFGDPCTRHAASISPRTPINIIAARMGGRLLH